jgi:predicted neuraminidase
MTLACSKDNGISWQKLRDTDTEPGGYSYPAVIATGDGGVALTYTYGGGNIKFIKLDSKEVFSRL